MSHDTFPDLPRSQNVWIKSFLAAVVTVILCGLLLPVTSDGPLPASHAKARTDVAQLVSALRAYTDEYGDAPHGNSSEIMRTLLGNNPRKIVYFECSPKDFSPFGELLDPWKTPYRIDTSNPRQPKIYSFGPNKHDDGDAPQSDDIDAMR